MTGLEYILLHVQDPILYVIRKQHRSSQTHVIPLADYYIIAGIVYQAPDLASVLNSRLVRMIFINKYLQCSLAFFSNCSTIFFLSSCLQFIICNVHLRKPCHTQGTILAKDIGGISKLLNLVMSPAGYATIHQDKTAVFLAIHIQ